MIEIKNLKMIGDHRVIGRVNFCGKISEVSFADVNIKERLEFNDGVYGVVVESEYSKFNAYFDTVEKACKFYDAVVLALKNDSEYSLISIDHKDYE